MPPLVTAALAVLAVPAVLVAYILFTEAIVQRVPRRLQTRVRPWLWLLPALGFVGVFLIYPTISTTFRSFFNRRGDAFIGFENYVDFFSRDETLVALRNNVIWMIALPAAVVGLGLLIAILVDRVRYESVSKAVIFLPMAISGVAASVIWRFMFELNPNVGTFNAAVTGLGGSPVAWLLNQPLNTFMVILSAGLKGISAELLEAARVDGANELQVFRRIVVPLLMPTIAVITTTMIIFALKTFDLVYVMTGGLYETEVMANRMYKELFNFSQPGRSAAIAVVLFVAIIPVMALNIQRFRQQEALR
jgi:alpha-glucoside transport system permease protein